MSVTSPVTGRVTGIVASGVTRAIGHRTRVDSPIYQILVKTDNAGTSTDTQFTLPATGTYDIDWGDDTVEEKTGAATHTYASAGEYVIKVTGGLTRIHFNNGGDRLKLLEVQNWGDAVWSSFNTAYFGCANCLFSATDALVLPADCFRAFRDCTAFNQSVANFNTAAVTNMSYMFDGCTAFNQSVANFDTAKVTNMSYMFWGCTAFNQSVANFDTAKVTNMSYMFWGCTAFNQSVANFNTAAVTNMSFMFYGCTAFNQSVANFNTAAVTNMLAMFTNCTAFNQSVANFNTAKVTTMLSMFTNCTAFNQSVANFNTAKVTTMQSMFQSCTAFNQSVANFDTAAVTTMASMFQSCTAFKQSLATFSLAALNTTARLNNFAQNTNINAASTTTNYDATLIAWAAQLPLTYAQSPNFGTAKFSAGAAADAKAALVTAGWTITDGGITDPTAYQILVKTDNAGTSTDTQFTLPATGTYDIDWGDGTVEEKTDAATHTYDEAGEYVIKVTGGLTRIAFSNGGDRLKLLEVQNWGDAVWSSFNAAYRGCENCLFNATDALVLPADCGNGFRGCSAFNQSVANFDTAKVTDMFAMFFGCTNFNQSVANFDTAKVTNMSYMFRGCTAFNQSVANFDTVKVTNMQNMFDGCAAFKQSVATFSLAGLAATNRLNGFAQNTNINAASTTTNYDATLIAWAAQLPLTHAQSPNFGTAKYSAGAAATARAELVTAGWSITDGGEEV